MIVELYQERRCKVVNVYSSEESVTKFELSVNSDGTAVLTADNHMGVRVALNFMPSELRGFIGMVLQAARDLDAPIQASFAAEAAERSGKSIPDIDPGANLIKLSDGRNRVTFSDGSTLTEDPRTGESTVS
jgi:hypothetical protein